MPTILPAAVPTGGLNPVVVAFSKLVFLDYLGGAIYTSSNGQTWVNETPVSYGNMWVVHSGTLYMYYDISAVDVVYTAGLPAVTASSAVTGALSGGCDSLVSFGGFIWQFKFNTVALPPLVVKSSNALSFSAVTNNLPAGHRPSRILPFGGFLWSLPDPAVDGNLAVYKSSDGATWTQVTADWGLGDRLTNYGYTADSNLMYIVGGNIGATDQTTTYTSSTGSVWAAASASAKFSARRSPQCLAFGGKLTLLGGVHSGVTLQDIWQYSTGLTSTGL